MTDTDNTQGSPFWRFSLGFYRMPDVASACLDLQDEAGVDVNVLLFLLWNASTNRSLPQAEVAKLDQAVRDWRDGTVIPLRRMRRALKAPPPGIDAGNAEMFRTRVKALELEAERVQQETMYALAQELPGDTEPSSDAAARASLAAYEAVHARKLPQAPLDMLLKALPAFLDRRDGARP